MRITALMLMLALGLMPTPVLGAPNCKKGKACGDTCIAANKTCHVGTGGEDGRSMDMFVRHALPTSPAPVAEAPDGADYKGLRGGFGMASQAALACGETHDTRPGESIRVEVTVEGDGQVLHASAMGPNRSTALGECVTHAVTSHLRFSSSDRALRTVTFTFRVGKPEPERAESIDMGAVEPGGDAQAAESPVSRTCRREDFEDFDAFVACRVEGQPSSQAPTPSRDPAEEARRREAAEAREALGRRATEQAAAAAEGERLTRRTVLSLLISGGVLDAAGLGLVAAAYASGETIAPPPDDGPICTVGKRCGDACIAAELMCHTPTGSGGSVKADPTLLWPGVAALAIGSGLLITALVIYRRNDPGASRLVITQRGVGLRF